MGREIDRRHFLRTASAAAGAFAYARPALDAAQKPAAVRISSVGYQPIPDYPIQSVAYFDVTMTDAFWKPKIDRNATVTIPFEVAKRADGRGRGFGGGVLEAAIMSLRTHPNPTLQAQVEARVRTLGQSAGGGNGGFEIAATYFTVTGKRDLLDPAIKSAAALYDTFVTKNPPFSGGERDAMNCAQLYRVTHDRRHLDLAKHYLDIRGLETSVNRSRHNQSYKPVLEQTEAVGHAVNCVTLMTSLADVGVLTGITAYLTAAQRMWADAVERKMYVTGGVGTTGNEGFGEPYSLPTVSAYAETCAALMFMTLNHRLFQATGDGKYIDVLERGLYNNAIGGVSTSGDRFFYVNRLASAGDGRDHRWDRASLECCPPNLVRFFASMPGLLYAQDPKGAIYVNLYASSRTSFTIGGSAIALDVSSGMPWDGRSTITTAATQDVRATIKLRIPGWARNQPAPGGLYSYATGVERPVSLSINGRRVSATPDRFGYVALDRLWQNGDVIAIEFPVDVRHIVADARVKEARGRVAVERGPIVYCAEAPDVPDGKALGLLVDPKTQAEATADPEFGAGTVVLKTTAGVVRDPSLPARPVTLIPYHLWANRGPGEMTVWLSTRPYVVGDTGPAGGLIFFDNPTFAADGWRYLEAAPFDQSAGAPWGCFRKLIAGARGTAIGTGRQNTADMIAACAEPGSAAQLCATLALNGVRGWFLPSRDELAQLYRALWATGAADVGNRGATDNVTYWASSQNSADMAAHIDFADLGRLHGDDKDFPRRVRAIRAI